MEPIVMEINADKQTLLFGKLPESCLSDRRFHNPAISQWFLSAATALRRDSYFKLHVFHVLGLSNYARGIVASDLDEVVKGLKLLSKAFIPFLFKNFIFINSAFRDALFIVNPQGKIQVDVQLPYLSSTLSLDFPDINSITF